MTTPTKLQLYNQALRMIGEGKLSSVTVNQPSRYHLDSIWDEDPIKQVLQETSWEFATRTLEWNYDPALEPGFGYRRVFTKPSNYVRTVSLCSDEYFRCPLTDYQIEAGYWYCDEDTIYLRYVSDADDYGKDYSLWTELFRNCVATKMAVELAISLTKSQAIQDRIQMKFDKYVSDAKSLNAQEKPTQFAPAGNWVRSRSGQRVYRGTYSSRV